jgi:hypothetical protein
MFQVITTTAQTILNTIPYLIEVLSFGPTPVKRLIKKYRKLKTEEG